MGLRHTFGWQSQVVITAKLTPDALSKFHKLVLPKNVILTHLSWQKMLDKDNYMQYTAHCM